MSLMLTASLISLVHLKPSGKRPAAAAATWMAALNLFSPPKAATGASQAVPCLLLLAFWSCHLSHPCDMSFTVPCAACCVTWWLHQSWCAVWCMHTYHLCLCCRGTHAARSHLHTNTCAACRGYAISRDAGTAPSSSGREQQTPRPQPAQNGQPSGSDGFFGFPVPLPMPAFASGLAAVPGMLALPVLTLLGADNGSSPSSTASFPGQQLPSRAWIRHVSKQFSAHIVRLQQQYASHRAPGCALTLSLCLCDHCMPVCCHVQAGTAAQAWRSTRPARQGPVAMRVLPGKPSNSCCPRRAPFSESSS